MINVQLYGLLRIRFAQEKLAVKFMEGDSVGSVLERAGHELQGDILNELLDREGLLQTGSIILLNRRNIYHLQGLDTSISDGDTLALFPPGAGG